MLYHVARGGAASWMIQLFVESPLETSLRGDFCARSCRGRCPSITCHQAFVLLAGFNNLQEIRMCCFCQCAKYTDNSSDPCLTGSKGVAYVPSNNDFFLCSSGIETFH